MQPQPIQFLREPDNHFTLSGVDVTFVCSVTMFNGFSNTFWFFNNTVIEAGSHYSISNSGHSTSTLTVKNVSIEDQGDYHCHINDWKTKIRSAPGHLHGLFKWLMYFYCIKFVYIIMYNLRISTSGLLPCSDLVDASKTNLMYFRFII